MTHVAGSRSDSSDPRGAGGPSANLRPTIADFKAALGRFVTGVTVVTTMADGVDHAMTASAFTSVSIDPQLVLVCVEKITRFRDAVVSAGVWAVSVLPAEAAATAEWLATRGRPLAGQLDGLEIRRGPATGCAVLGAGLAVVECRTWAVYDGGDHDIVVGEVLAVDVPTSDGPALTYGRGGYGRHPWS